jgi:hypothetical protein
LEGREYAERLLSLPQKSPFFGTTELSMELWNIIFGTYGTAGFDD